MSVCRGGLSRHGTISRTSTVPAHSGRQTSVTSIIDIPGTSSRACEVPAIQTLRPKLTESLSGYIVAVRSAGTHPQWVSARSESFVLSLVPFGGDLATRSTRRSAHLHGLLPPILSAHGYHLAHLLWYCYPDLFLLSGFLLRGCTHRCCDRDNRYRGQSGHHFA